MNALPHVTRLPTFTAVAGLLLAGWYGLLFKPLSGRVSELDRPLTNVWNSFVQTNRAYEACAGLNLTNVAARLATLQTSLTNLQVSQRSLQARLEFPADVKARMLEPFQLIDFQNERMQQAEALMRLAKEKGAVLEPLATNGLPEYSVDLLDPRLLWPRLHLANQLLLTAVHCKIGGVRSLNQLPAVSHRSPLAAVAGLEELPMRIELFGSAESLAQFVTSLPLRGAELNAVGLAATLTNKPVYFVDQVLARKHSPERPGDVQLDLTLCGWFWSAPEKPGTPAP